MCDQSKFVKFFSLSNLPSLSFQAYDEELNPEMYVDYTRYFSNIMLLLDNLLSYGHCNVRALPNFKNDPDLSSSSYQIAESRLVIMISTRKKDGYVNIDVMEMVDRPSDVVRFDQRVPADVFATLKRTSNRGAQGLNDLEIISSGDDAMVVLNHPEHGTKFDPEVIPATGVCLFCDRAVASKHANVLVYYSSYAFECNTCTNVVDGGSIVRFDKGSTSYPVTKPQVPKAPEVDDAGEEYVISQDGYTRHANSEHFKANSAAYKWRSDFELFHDPLSNFFMIGEAVCEKCQSVREYRNHDCKREYFDCLGCKQVTTRDINSK